MSSSQQKIALVTGANRGLGFEISPQLARQCIQVIMGVRDTTKGQIALHRLQQDGLTVSFQCLDVTDSESIESIRFHIDKNCGRLDVLVNNAGVYLDVDKTPNEVRLDVVRQTLGTNFIGAVAITQVLLPLIHKDETGRIVNMSSGRGSLTQHSEPNCHCTETLAYNSSKTALNAFTVMLAAELKNTNIKVNSTDPDWCCTDMGTEAATHSIAKVHI